jgi:hypothetical protein
MSQLSIALSFESFGKPPLAPAKQPERTRLDRATACALVDAGYMTLRSYFEQFGFDPPGEGEVVEAGAHRLSPVQ